MVSCQSVMGGIGNGNVVYGISSWLQRVEGNHSWASGQSSKMVATTRERKAVTSAECKAANEDKEATLTSA
jgi:hypothetical protein